MADVKETAKRLRRAAALQERWHTERDELIYQAYVDGVAVREIARLVGMSHPGVLSIIARQREGTYETVRENVPRERERVG